MSVHIKKREAYKPKRTKRASRTANRAKTFKSEEAANLYAKANNIANFVLRNLSISGVRKKLKIVQK